MWDRTNEKFLQFEEDMSNAGFLVDDEGTSARFTHERVPCVHVEREDFQDVVRATSLRLREESMGMGIVVYPV